MDKDCFAQGIYTKVHEMLIMTFTNVKQVDLEVGNQLTTRHLYFLPVPVGKLSGIG